MPVRTDELAATAATPALVNEDAFRWPSEPLAKGGMAVVYEGEDRRLARKVILKAPREDVEVPEGMENVLSERLIAEAEVLARLQHPSIVTIFEMGRATTGTPFCVLERVEGRALRDVLEDLDEAELDGEPRRRERLELLQGLVSIAEALAYAHERGVVHRDVTPNNILLGARGEPTLIDWGLAKDIGAQVEQGTLTPGKDDETLIAGTPPYVSYEQTRGQAADPSYDVYSFGVTLYEVVAGRTPFPWMHGGDSLDREKRLARFMRWLEHGEAAPPALPDDPELSGILARAIAHDPAERFTADELVRALKQYLTGELVFSHRYSLIGRAARWVRRHRGVAVSLAGLALAVVAVVIVTLALLASNARNARDRAELQAQTAEEAQKTAELETANQEAARKNAELGALATAAKLDANDKAKAASDAADAAAAAEARAKEAERRGENADTLRADAEKQRQLALAAQTDAEEAAKRAQGDASDAQARWTEAMAARDAAVAAQKQADADRVAAEQAKAQADDARAKAEQAKADDDQALAQEKAARQAAEQAATAAQNDKVSADEARARAESDLASARHRIDDLEARVKELESQHEAPPPPPPSGGGDGSASGSADPPPPAP